MLTDRVQRRQVFAPMHWTRQNSRNGHINALVTPVTDPVSGQPALKTTAVTIKSFAAGWYGFLASENPIRVQSDYCAVARTATGWTAELAGTAPREDWEVFLGQLTDVTAGEVSRYCDPKSGQTRLAVTCDGRIVALLFVGLTPVGLSRRNAVQSIGTLQPTMNALAGRAGDDFPDDGAILCSCFSIGVNAIQRAISRGADTVAKIGERTCAGTNCGSCRPELAEMLAARMPKLAAE
jgi:assimilatory nitrate reductase catalytic subunit